MSCGCSASTSAEGSEPRIARPSVASVTGAGRSSLRVTIKILVSSFCTRGIGAANHFHSKNPQPDPERRAPDDTETPSILWPNYHSGKNGDFQKVEVPAPVHPIMRNGANASGHIELLPAHPHEGAISVPSAESTHARVVAVGKSAITGRPFNLAIAFERNGNGRAVVDSSFHHFLDYNLDPRAGCPSFVTE